MVVEAGGWTLGSVSWLLSPWTIIGMACAFFHVLVCGCWARQCVDRCGIWSTFKVALILWTVAWTDQVAIGHWLLEVNQPDVADMSNVSWLAMTQSVLMAWKS